MHYTITIDRELCRGYAECAGIAPEVFGRDAEERSIVLDAKSDSNEMILEADRGCPVDAVTLVEQHGDWVWP
jgi:ferredoxin